MTGFAVYALLWASFGAGHSLLARGPGQRLLARLAGRGERLAYNAVAAVHLGLILWLGRLLLPGDFALPLALRMVMALMIAAGIAILAVAGRAYDLGRFLGTAQLRDDTPSVEPLATGGMNAIVRHPLYLGLLLVLWGAAASPFMAATAAFATLYIRIGIFFEERKLLALYGHDYQRYRASVPMLIPRVLRRA